MNKNKKFLVFAMATGVAAAILGVISIALSAGDQDVVATASAIPEETTTTILETTTTTSTVVETTTTTEAYIPPPTTAYIPPPEPQPEVVQEPIAPVVASGSIEEMICNTFGDQCQKALSVAWCESRYNPGTVGAAGERGIMQIHPVHIQYLGNYGLTWDDMFDPAANLTYAYALYSSQGWGPWTCA